MIRKRTALFIIAAAAMITAPLFAGGTPEESAPGESAPADSASRPRRSLPQNHRTQVGHRHHPGPAQARRLGGLQRTRRPALPRSNSVVSATVRQSALRRLALGPGCTGQRDTGNYRCSRRTGHGSRSGIAARPFHPTRFLFPRSYRMSFKLRPIRYRSLRCSAYSTGRERQSPQRRRA